MDRVLLKRLLGAGVLMALAVIILPFILQGEGYKAALRTDIPARPQPPQPLDMAMREPPPEVLKLLEPPSPLPGGQAAAADSESAKEAADAGAGKTAAKPVMPPPPASKPAPAPQAAAPKSASEASKAEATPNNAAAKPGASPSPPTAKPQTAGVWMIQLGSFSVEANAEQLRAQVQRVGIPCVVEPLDIEGRKVWRVRAGPFPTQAEADAALKRLQAGLKLGGMVMQVR